MRCVCKAFIECLVHSRRSVNSNCYYYCCCYFSCIVGTCSGDYPQPLPPCQPAPPGLGAVWDQLPTKVRSYPYCPFAGVNSSQDSVVSGDLSAASPLAPDTVGWEPVASVRRLKLAGLEEIPEPPALSPTQRVPAGPHTQPTQVQPSSRYNWLISP